MNHAAVDQNSFQGRLSRLLHERFETAPALPWEAVDPVEVPDGLWREALTDPLDDFLNRPGKEFRARFVHACYLLSGGNAPAYSHRLAEIIEIFHAGSLVIDDIQDGSTLRRNDMALHLRWGLPRALNGANWMYFWAMTEIDRAGLSPHIRLALYRQTSIALMRCHQGQALDIATRVDGLGRDDVPAVVDAVTRLKTGSLMQLASSYGAISAGAEAHVIRLLSRFAIEIGRGLQMLDDLGGLASPRRREKGLEDLRQSAPTWPWAWLAGSATRSDFADLQRMASGVRDGADPDLLREQLLERTREAGMSVIRATLDAALAELGRHFTDATLLGAINDELEALQKSYD